MANPFVGFLALLLSITAIVGKDLELYCGACHTLVEEINWEISQTDPKRTIQVGSFRIMPDGTQRLNEIPYKQSGVQISELLDDACSRPSDYYQTTDENSGRKLFKRQNRRDGQSSALKSVVISKETNKMLKFACESIAEDFEEEIISAFKNKEDESYLSTICVNIAELCTEDQLYDVNPEVAVDGGEHSGDDSIEDGNDTEKAAGSDDKKDNDDNDTGAGDDGQKTEL